MLWEKMGNHEILEIIETVIKKLKNQPNKQLIISKNNHKLSKKYSLTHRAKRIIDEIKF